MKKLGVVGVVGESPEMQAAEGCRMKGHIEPST